MSRFRGRKSLRDTIIANQAQLDAYALLSGKPRMELNIPEAPKPRAPRQASGKPLERDVQAPVIDLLRRHPRVAWFVRINSGVAAATDARGDARYTAFYRLYLRGEKPQSSGLGDVMGQLTDGRLFVMEVKRPGIRRGTEAQEQVIAAVLAAGGIAGIVQSVEDAIALLR